MSTQLLSSPGKAHELCDDLESLWFVLLFESLHFVKHNKPDQIEMATLFDDHKVNSAGVHVGGGGKRGLYHSGLLVNKMLKFECTPFTILIRQIYQLFRSLEAHYVAQEDDAVPSDPVKKDVRKLESCAGIQDLLAAALNSEGWSTCDKVEDQYPPTRRPTPQRKETVALSYVSHSLVPSGAHSGGGRKREVEDDPPFLNETKRYKVDPLWKQFWTTCTYLVWG